MVGSMSGDLYLNRQTKSYNKIYHKIIIQSNSSKIQSIKYNNISQSDQISEDKISNFDID